MQKLLLKGKYIEYDYEYELYEKEGEKFEPFRSTNFVEIYNKLSAQIKENYYKNISTSVEFKQEFFANDYAMIVFLYDQYIDSHKNANLILEFKFNDDDYSAKHFLLGYDKLQNNWSEKRILSQNLKKIMPLMIFDNEDYLNLSKSFFNKSDDIKEYVGCIKKYVSMSDENIELEIKQDSENIKKYRDINKQNFEKALKKIKETYGYSLSDERLEQELLKENIYNYYKKQYITDLAISKINNTFNKKMMFFVRIITNNLFEYYKSLKNDEIEINIPEMDYLTMYFYSLFLSNFAKKIYENRSQNDFLVDKILLYAQIYSQSIFQIIENACLHSDGKKAYFYVRIYDHINNDEYKHIAMFSHVKKRFNFEEKNQSPFHVEVGVIDYSKEGLLAQYRKKIKAYDDMNMDFSLSDIYSFDNKNSSLNNYLSQEEQIVFHHGLKLFSKIMKINNCTYVVQSNNEKHYSTFKKQKDNEVDATHNGVGTAYTIILPMPIKIDGLDNSTNKELPNSSEMFDYKYINNLYDIQMKTIDLDNKNEDIKYNNQAEKEELCEKQAENIYEDLVKNTLHHIKYDNISFNNVEILAKALRLAIFKHRKADENDKIFIVLDINNDLLINEFIRQFSVFYSRNIENDNFQLAICSKDDYGKYRVNFILSGYGYANVLENARKYLYYNFENTKKYFINLSYFKPDYLENKTKDNRMFPFDLYLNNFLGKGNHRDNLFVTQLNSILDKPLENKEYGCLLEDVHLRLGSKIHIKKFYEAELLFHNLGVNYRFAYLLANRISEKNEEKKKIILLGYENYSETLILELERLLNLNDIDTQHIIVLNGSNVNERIKISHNVKEGFNDFDYSKCEFVYIIPLGSTLSTVLKMEAYLIDYIKLNFDKEIDESVITNQVSYCLILFRDKENNDENVEEIEKKYWDYYPNLKLIKIKKSDILIDFFIQKGVSWQDANSCEMCCINKRTDNLNPEDILSEKVLFHVDKSSTLPNITFIMNQRGKKDFDIPKENDKRILKLEGSINYAHIDRNNNHYQFYIDACDYFEREEEDIKKWLKEIGSKINFGRNNFNIIVSPLHGTNSEFLKAIVDNAFEHNTRFLHFSISDTSREDIRTKFSYITDEYKNMIAIKELANDCDIKIYYVDDIMSTCSSITRAASLIRMLLEESNESTLKKRIFDNNNKIFESIFLLINRNSYDTINNYVEDPKTQLFSYCNIKLPSIKKYNNKCPNCEMDNKYLNIMASCATLDLRNDFRRLYEKHHLRTNEEYFLWLKTEIEKENSGFYKWKKSWEYMHLNSGEELSDEEFINIGIQKRNFLRLYCVDKINKIIDNFDATTAEYRKDIEKKAIKLFIEEIFTSCFIDFNKIMLNDFKKTKYSPNKICSLAIEIIISYIKVSSRTIISRYHIAKQAILSIMLTMLLAFEKAYEESENKENEIFTLCQVLVGKENKETINKLLLILRLFVSFNINSFSEISEKEVSLFKDSTVCAAPLQKYQLFFTLIRRLSLLESTYVLRFSTIKKYFAEDGMLAKFEDEYNNYQSDENYTKFNEINFDDIVQKYKNILKWCTTSNAEINRSTFLEEQLKEELEKIDDYNGKLKKIIVEAFLENNRIIENAMKYLYEKNNISEVTLTEIEKDCKIQKPLYELHKIVSYYFENEQIYEKIKSIFDLYNTIKTSANSNKFKTRSIIKELCEKIRKIANCDIVFAYEFDETNGKVKELMFNVNKNNDDAETYIKYKKWSENNMKILRYKETPEGLTVIDIDETSNNINSIENENFIVKIKIPIEYYNINENTLDYDSTSQTKYIYFLLDYETKSKERIKILFNLKSILSMRGELIDMFSKNVNVLNDENYYLIDNFNKEESHINLLHISDIHFLESENESIYEEAFEKLSDMMIELKPELLIVTGDIINYCISGQDMLLRYNKIDDLFQKLLIKVYQDEWKERIIFVPGNHDYASMNEIIAKSENRELTGAFVPSTISKSSVGVKYSYYLDFIENYRLNISRKELIYNNLNYLEKRFNQINLEFLLLNSCFLAAPYRQNKITYDIDNINEILKQSSKKSNITKICLAHHSIINNIDYFTSRGGEFKLCIEEISKKMKEIVKNPNDYEPRDCANIIIRYILKQYNYSGKFFNRYKVKNPNKAKFEYIYDKIKDKVKNETVLNFINGIYNKSNIELCNTILSDILATQADEKNKDELQKILKENGFKLMLSGHTHKYNYVIKNEICVCESAKFIELSDDKKTAYNINYQTIKIEHKSIITKMETLIFNNTVKKDI